MFLFNKTTDPPVYTSDSHYSKLAEGARKRGKGEDWKHEEEVDSLSFMQIRLYF